MAEELLKNQNAASEVKYGKDNWVRMQEDTQKEFEIEEEQRELISIVIPVYNAEKHLETCLNSLLQQSYKNFEIILVNDGSADGSLEICNEYAQADDRVRVYTQENSGPSVARNRGVRHAAGDFLVFCDADDWMDTHALCKMHAAMTKYQTDLVIGGYARFTDGNAYSDSCHRLSRYSMVIMQSNKELASLYFEPRSNLMGISIWGKMYRMSIIREHAIVFPEDINYEEDCCFNLQYFRHVRTTAVLRDILYHYRQAMVSLSKTYNPKGFGFLINGFNERCKFLQEIGLDHRIQKLRSVFIVVIIATYKKIARSELDKAQRIAEYQRVMDFPEVKEIIDNTALPRKIVSRKIIQAVRQGSAKKAYHVMEIWKLGSRIKRKCGGMRVVRLLKKGACR